MENGTEIKFVFWIGTLMMVLLTLCIILITTLYHRRILLIQNKEAENLLKISLETEQKERRRIASDLHDSINGDINAIRNFVTVLTTREEDTYKKSILSEIKSALDLTNENLQMISYNLMPPLLESLGLVAVFKDYFDRCRKWNKITIEDSYSHETIPIQSEIGFELFRITQELINNILKHSKASLITFRLEDDNDRILLKITDNGTTYDFKTESVKSKGLGLKNIQSRIKQIKADLQHNSVADGNQILIVFQK